MHEQFTDKAKNVLRYAKEIARKQFQTYIGCEHLLYGLFREKNSVASQVLEANGVSKENLSEMLSSYAHPSGGEKPSAGEMEYTPKALSILAESHRQAAIYKEEKTGTEHILLAMIQDGNNLAVKFLKEMQIDYYKMYITDFSDINIA